MRKNFIKLKNDGQIRLTRKVKIFSVILFILVFGASYSAQGQNIFQGLTLYYVDRGDDNTFTNCDPITPNDCTLRGAIQRANTDGVVSQIQLAIPQNFGQTIVLGGTLSINNDQSLLITSDPIFIGDNGTNRRTVSGGFGVRVFSVNPGATVTFRNIGIQDGRFSSPNDGAGIDNNGGTVTIENCNLSNNNSTDDAGAVKNTALGTMTIINTEFHTNISPARGGAIFNEGNLTISNSLFRNNNAQNGGAIANSGTLTIKNTTISGNDASMDGGGIYTQGGTVNLESNTITGNRADFPSNGSGLGGGVGKDLQNRTVNVGNCIIAGNTGTQSVFGWDFNGDLTSQGYNLIAITSGVNISGQTFGNQLGVDPKLLPLRANGGSLMTHALAPNSPAIDKGSNINLPSLTIDNRGLPRRFDFPGISDTNTGVDIGAFERQPSDRNLIDYEGDRKTDLSIFRPAPGEWWYLKSSDGGNAAAQFGQSTDKIVPGDYTGDGKTDFAFFRPSNGNWFVLRSEDSSFFAFPFGNATDIPAPADYDGDGKTDAAVFRPSTLEWFILKSTGGTDIITFGAAGDKPVVGDYDGDLKADIAIFRPGPGQWWIRRSTNQTVFATNFGTSTDKPVQGDYTGDGKVDIAFWRPATGEWFISRSEDFSFFSFPFGANNDLPVPGDYDGDGKNDAAVFRTPNNWFVQRSTAGTLIQQFGIGGDLPTPAAFVP